MNTYRLWIPENIWRYGRAYLAMTIFLPWAFRMRFVITGIPKSGTTWMAMIMSAGQRTHVEIEGGPGSREYKMRHLILMNPDFNLEDKDSHASLKKFKEMMIKHAFLSGKHLLGYKVPDVRADALRSAFPQAKVAYIYRDGRDFVVSDAFHNLRLGRIEGDPRSEEFWEAAIHRRAPYWREMVLKNLVQFRQIYGQDFFEIRYEDLLDPDRGRVISERLFQFFGYTSEDSDLAWEANRFEKLSGGRKPGNEDRSSFFRKGISGDWLHYFSDKNLQTFLNVAGDALQFLDYPVD